MPQPMEQRSLNQARQARARPTAGRKPQGAKPQGVFARLASEHLEVTAMIRQLLESQENDAKTRRNLWAEIARLLVAHDRAELQEVYKALEAYPTLRFIVEEHRHQVHELEALVDELNAVPINTQVWRMAFQRLEAVVKQHMADEESKFFPQALEVIGKDKAKLLEIPYLSAKRSLLEGL